MEYKKISLPKKFSNQLIEVPESGMGYHVVDILLKNGNELKSIVVLNCEILKIPEEINIIVEDIKEIKISIN